MANDRFHQEDPEFLDFGDPKLLKAVRDTLKDRVHRVGRQEAIFLVNLYYEFQADRVRGNNRLKAIARGAQNEPAAVLDYFTKHFENIEKLMGVPLKEYAESNPVGQWLLSIKGIGPVLAAGLLAHLDITKAHSPAHFWSFAGYDPSVYWNGDEWVREILPKETYMIEMGHIKGVVPVRGDKNPAVPSEIIGLGRRRPFNSDLKVLMFKVGKSFVMAGRGEIYREMYDRRKSYEASLNQQGAYQKQAALLLSRLRKVKEVDVADAVIDEGDVLDEETIEELTEGKKFRATLESGKLVPAHLDARARRWTGKLFLSHLHTVLYEMHYKRPAPDPFALAHLNHTDLIPVPNYTPLPRRAA